MDYRHFRLVSVICHHGSFGRAARALGISQPALSKSIARLEDQLGVKLFARGDGRTQPTMFALHIVERTRLVLDDSERIAIEVSQMAIGETGRVRIGAEPISRFGLLPILVDEITETFPRLRLEILDRPGAEIAESLMAREIDIGITNLGRPSASAELDAFALFSSPVIAVARPEHPIFSQDSPKGLDDYPVVLIERPETPVAWPKAGSVAGPVDIVRELVARTDAITRGPEFLFHGDIARGALRKLPEPSSGVYVCHLLVTRGALHSAVIGRIVDSARSSASALGGLAPPGRD